jgi:hypothetical protein
VETRRENEIRACWLVTGVEKDGMRFWNIAVTEYGVPIVRGCSQDKRRISFCVDSYKPRPRESPSDPYLGNAMQYCHNHSTARNVQTA